MDDALTAIERDNPSLKDVLPKDYALPALDKTRLGSLVDLVSNIQVGDQESRSKDVLGRVYEYFLSQFAGAEGKKGGEFYTPRSVVRLLVENAGAPTTGASTTLAVVLPACSSNRWTSSRPTPAATATAGRPRATSPSTDRSPTTPLGA